MKTRIENQNVRALKACLLALALPLFSACVKGGSVSSSSDGGGASTSGSLTISAVFPTDTGITWTPITLSNRYYVKGLKLSITGVCSRGVATIKVDEGSGDYPETTACDDNGDFTWSKVYTGAQEGDKTLTLTAYDVTDTAISGATAQTQVRVDNTAPPAPVITDPATTPFTINTNASTYVVHGTAALDVSKVQLPGSNNFVTPSAGLWTYTATLQPNQSLTFQFSTWDLAGNQSAVTSQVIQWNPTISVKIAGAYQGGFSTDTGSSGFTIESNVYVVPGKVTDSGTGFTLETGFNQVTHSARAP